MATGDQSDFVRRLRGLLPNGWFPSPPASGEPEKAPVLVGILTGLASGLAWIWTLFVEAQAQTRLTTSAGMFIEAFANDVFGAGAFPRASGESDATYIARIQASLIAKKNTRAAISAAVEAVTGAAPTIIETMNAADCHGYGCLAVPAAGGGYGTATSGLRTGTLIGGQFFMIASNPNGLTLSTIYAAAASAKAEGVIAWIQADAPSELGTFVVGANTV